MATSINITRELPVSLDQVWAALADFGGPQKWAPTVSHAYLTSRQDEGAGTSRQCHLTDGSTIQETVTDWRSGRGYTFEITGLPGIMAFARADLDVTPAGPSRSTLSFTFHYATRFGPLGWVMNRLMIRPQFARRLRLLVDGLQDYAATLPAEGTDAPLERVA